MGKKIFRVDQLNVVTLGKFLRPAADQKHVFGFFHDRSREGDRIADMFNAGDGTGTARFSIHDGGIHFIRASACKNRAFAGIKMRIVFQHAHRRFDRVQCRAAAAQDRNAGPQRIFDPGAILALAFRCHFARLDRSRPSMHDQGNVGLAHGRSRRTVLRISCSSRKSERKTAD